ncbi:transporter protein, putative [Plasmodium knowlesi strain H]|uniref:Transporter protein, putative n=3 Tax=Plasmodium knowlesi TaxID=5850 RepID=A0A5K1VAP0_PLAKH|nr:major facilitator superfamily domain-containing protein, putative [Plasmodium knowlesi strain H]OTN67694.1 putative Transporter protein [Plasmodium knowlesi]CAA9990341.1 major facilitator superfamily domain-containing protein, putative [Plasmodium knowlesi strain H]SBO19547.1 transporter protein, putative [Plasmodium knowlesi strain H]SBO22739.1 transporter protein, putative [Plasmodium knowlesi strain H]VVS79815.1 major facilitator superfamily domain-containing protein, putative [Plasmodiu|eukprot:XP_002260743.1 transporter protein, putative [Plasmodium knowlesi strain H]
MEKTETSTNEGAGKWWKGGMSIIRNMIQNQKKLFPQSNLQYTYINTFILCLLFTFIHKYLDQTLPSLYKSIENDFNIDVKTLYYMNTMYKLAYSAFNFFFALFFDYSFKKIFLEKYEEASAGKNIISSTSGNANGERNDGVKEDRVGGVDSGVSDTQYEIQFKGEQESGTNKAACVNSGVKVVEEEKTTNGEKKRHNSTYVSDEVIWSEYRYTLNILVVSSIVYVVVIFGIMLSNNFLYFFFFMFIMGINNSCIYILIQKIYTNNVFSENRSTIFGFLHFFSSISHMVSISINTNLSNKFYLGFNGWRICYFVISFFPILVCIYLLGLIKQKKFQSSRSKNYSFSYLVSLDHMTDICQESEKEENCFKRENNKLENLQGASKERADQKKKKKKKKEEEEILLFNAEQGKPSMEGNCGEVSEKVEEQKHQHQEEGHRHLPLGTSKSYDSKYVLHREGLANISKACDDTAYLHNSSKLSVRHSASTNDDLNTISLISASERINSNLIKRSLCHMALKKGSSLKGTALNVDASRSSSGESAVSGEGDCTTVGKGNYSKWRKNHMEDADKKKKKKKTSLEDDANEMTGKGTNSASSPSSIFAKRNEEREKYEHREELDNLLEDDEKEKDKKMKYEFSYLYEIKYVFKNYSFWLMITMGMLNGIPKHVLSLMIYFFQYCNISDFRSGLIISLSWLCASLISPFIGIISDYIYKLNKDINRQRIGMCTHCLRIILMFTMFFFVPKEADSFIYFVIISLLMGILSGWINIGTHKPIIIDIVKQRHTAFVMALMSAFENIGSSIIGTFFLSFLLNRYNYIDKRKVGSVHVNVNSVHVNVNKHNVHVLSDVLLILTCFPWLISFCLLYVLKFTYKKDKLYNNLF